LIFRFGKPESETVKQRAASLTTEETALSVANSTKGLDRCQCLSCQCSGCEDGRVSQAEDVFGSDPLGNCPSLLHCGFEFYLAGGPYRVFGESGWKSFHDTNARHLSARRKQNLQGHESLHAIAARFPGVRGLRLCRNGSAHIRVFCRHDEFLLVVRINNSGECTVVSAAIILIPLRSDWRRLIHRCGYWCRFFYFRHGLWRFDFSGTTPGLRIRKRSESQNRNQRKYEFTIQASRVHFSEILRESRREM